MWSPLFVMFSIFLIDFTCIYFVSTFLSRGSSFVATEPHAMHHLERTDDNTYKQVAQFTIKTGWRDSTLVFCNLAKAFKHNTICDSNGIQTHNHLVRKRTLNHFAKLSSGWLALEYLSVRYSLRLQISHLFRGSRYLIFRKLQSAYSLWNAYMTW